MNLARGREYSAMSAPSTYRSPACAAWWKRTRRIRATSRPSGVWATSSSRTVLRHETRALFAAQLLCSHTAPDRHLAVRQPGDDYLVVLNFAILPSLQQFNKVLAYEVRMLMTDKLQLEDGTQLVVPPAFSS